MTAEGDGGNQGRGHRRRSKPTGPRHDPGPAATQRPERWVDLPFTFRRTMDEFVAESLEAAAVLAEEAVIPFLASRKEERFHGSSFVEMRFRDESTLSSFRRTASIHLVRGEAAWRLVRRWAEAEGDGGLDEAICGVVAGRLNEVFVGLLEARVVTWVTRR